MLACSTSGAAALHGWTARASGSIHCSTGDLRRRVGERIERSATDPPPSPAASSRQRCRRERHDLRERSLHEREAVAGLQLRVVTPEQELGRARGQLGVCGAGEGRDPQPAAGVLGQHAGALRHDEAHRHLVRRGPHRAPAGRRGRSPTAVTSKDRTRRRRVPVVELGCRASTACWRSENRWPAVSTNASFATRSW